MSTPQESIQSLVERLERLEAFEAIRQLKARYLNACDRQDPQGVSRCFAEGDVLIDMGHLGVFHHRDEFVAMYRGYGCHEYVLDMHHGANAEIELIDAFHARALWSLNYRNINTRDRTVTFLSVHYHDEYVRLAGEWKIVTCRVEYKTALHLSYAEGALQTLLAAKSVAGAVTSAGVAE
jgi:SnoaL-like domain